VVAASSTECGHARRQADEGGWSQGSVQAGHPCHQKVSLYFDFKHKIKNIAFGPNGAV
jgi:hypothetical protein